MSNFDGTHKGCLYKCSTATKWVLLYKEVPAVNVVMQPLWLP